MTRSNFWENAHTVEIYNNWTVVSEKFPFLEHASSYIHKAHPTALDIGCSIGEYSRYLASRGFHVDAIDISKTAIKTAIQQSKDVQDISFKVGDIRKTVLEKNTYDLIIDFSCFTHIKQQFWQSYILNVSNSLKNDGIFLLCCWSKSSTSAYGINPSALENNFYVKKIPSAGSFYNYFFTKKDLRDHFKRYFSILSVDERRAESFKKIQPNSDLRFLFAIMKKRK
jgi:2-polyprenyl-3-methyl-5-hydroxy-6-metoxy-1,4-benzoquinol methylase